MRVTQIKSLYFIHSFIIVQGLGADNLIISSSIFNTHLLRPLVKERRNNQLAS